MPHLTRLKHLSWTLLAVAACSSASAPTASSPDAASDTPSPDVAMVDTAPVADVTEPRDDGKGTRNGPCVTPFDCEHDLAGRQPPLPGSGHPA